jgi:transposase-like protein
MKLTLEEAAQILGISAPLLRWRIRHQPRAGVRRAKPATVALAAVLKYKTTMVKPSSNGGRPR